MNDYMTYEEYKQMKVKYKNAKCGVLDCGKPAPYEGGDERCWFSMCEEHAKLKDRYKSDKQWYEYKCNNPEPKSDREISIERAEKALKKLRGEL